jgi:hypothetical protein
MLDVRTLEHEEPAGGGDSSLQSRLQPAQGKDEDKL